MSRSPQFDDRSKHIRIKYHFVRDQVTEGTIKLKYCPTTEMVADMLTKGLPKDQFMKLREMIGLDKCSDSQWGGVLEQYTLSEHMYWTLCGSLHCMLW